MTTTPGPVLVKRADSRAPWRIEVTRSDGRSISISYCHFDRKRDALPWLARFQALAGLAWDTDSATWPPEHHDVVWAIVEATPGYQEYLTLCADGPRSPR